MKKKILLTGATGFVGRQVLKWLQEHDVQFRLILLAGEEDKIESSPKLDSIITTQNLFSESLQWWEEALSGIDTVIHLAWYVEPGKYLQSEKNLDCLSGTLNMAKSCVEKGVRRFIGTGTCFEYDLSKCRLSVDTPLHPASLYAASKASAFLLLSQCFKNTCVKFAWCRLFYLFGEGEDGRRFVPYLRSKLEKGESAELTSGTQIRDFMNVTDAGKDIVELAMSNTVGPVNICSGRPITIRQMAEQIADQYGRRDLLNFGVRPENLVDPPCVVGVK